MSKGRFFAIEGVDGVGKSTLATRLASTLSNAVYEREPTPEPIGQMISTVLRRQIVLEDPMALQMLFAADRLEHSGRIQKTLADGRDVVCDRYDLSSITHAVALLGTDVLDWVREINDRAIRPDVTIVLHLPFEVCAARLALRSQRDIFEHEEMQQKIRRLYAQAEYLLPNDRVAHVNADGSPDDVFARVLSAHEVSP